MLCLHILHLAVALHLPSTRSHSVLYVVKNCLATGGAFGGGAVGGGIPVPFLLLFLIRMSVAVRGCGKITIVFQHHPGALLFMGAYHSSGSMNVFFGPQPIGLHAS